MGEGSRNSWQRSMLALALGPTAGLGVALLILEFIPLRANVAYLQLFQAALAVVGFVIAYKALTRPDESAAEQGDEGWHSDAVQADDASRVFSAFNPAEARLASHVLEQLGIPFQIRNENVTFLRGELPMDDCWVEIWVPSEHREDALAALDRDVSNVSDVDDSADDDETVHASDAVRLARRALRTAIIGIIVVPPLLHPYALSLCLKALRAEGSLDSGARWRLVAATAVSLAMLAAAAALMTSLGWFDAVLTSIYAVVF